jgi:RimJ/RimL family protein N-acetyltransferase
MYASLNDSSIVFIREIRPSDKDMLARGLQALSEDSRHKRFLGPKPSLSASELRYLTEVDGHDHRALVAVPAGQEEQIIAVARYVRLADDDGAAAEAAITVCDDMQGKGLGSLLARLISDAARDHGIRRITATIASDNRRALALMRRIDERLAGAPVGSSVTELVAQLPEAPVEDDEDHAPPASSAVAAA